MSVLVAALAAISAACLATAAAAHAVSGGRSLAGFDHSESERMEVDRGSIVTRRHATVVAAGIVGFAISGFPGLVLGIAGAIVARRVREHRTRRAAAGRHDEQLADAITGLAGAVRAGLSVPQGIADVAGESDEPLRSELSAVREQLDLGVPLSDALDGWAGSSAGADVGLVVGALELHRRSGGDLPLVLDGVAASLHERVAAAREVRALTAQARLSGAILACLPIGFFAFLWLTSRDDMQRVLENGLGIGAVVLGLGLDAGAFLWIRHLLRVEA